MEAEEEGAEEEEVTMGGVWVIGNVDAKLEPESVHHMPKALEENSGEISDESVFGSNKQQEAAACTGRSISSSVGSNHHAIHNLQGYRSHMCSSL